MDDSVPSGAGISLSNAVETDSETWSHVASTARLISVFVRTVPFLSSSPHQLKMNKMLMQ